MTTNQTVGIVIAAIIIIAGAWYLFTPHDTAAPGTATATTTTDDMGAMNTTGTANGTTVTTSTTTTTTAIPGQPLTVTYTKNGFNPSSFSVQVGTTVTWVNNSTQQLEVAVDPHPTHTSYDGTTRAEHCVANAPVSSTTFDECVPINPGESWSFTFTKVGSWGYHNHLLPNDTGTVTVIPGKATTNTTVKVQVQ